MKALTWIEYLNQAEPVLLQVFNDPEISQFWCQPFASSIESQVLIAPYKFTIEPPMTDALVAAAIAEGTKACYISGLWRSHQYSNDWYVPIDEFTRAYSGDEIQDALIWKSNPSFCLSDSVIYSADGDWGIWTNHEWFGVIGGSKSFVEPFYCSIPDIEQQVFDFLEYVRQIKFTSGRHATLDWVRPLLSSVYGEKQALNLMLESGLAVAREKGIKILI